MVRTGIFMDSIFNEDNADILLVKKLFGSFALQVVVIMVHDRYYGGKKMLSASHILQKKLCTISQHRRIRLFVNRYPIFSVILSMQIELDFPTSI